MMQKQFRICIIGAGAIGGVVAGTLAKEKYNLTLVVKHPDLAGKIGKSGIELSGHFDNFTVAIPVVVTPEKLKGKFDFVLIATKADGLVDSAKRVLPFLDENSRVVSLQNGICEEMLAEVVGVERTIGCAVGFGATMLEPGRVEYYNGYIANKGKELGVPTPVNRRLTRMVREIESGDRPISPENFKEMEILSPEFCFFIP